MNNIFDAILNEAWGILPNALDAILQIVDRGIDSTTIDPKLFHASGQTEPQALLSIQGERLDGARRAVLRGTTAIIPVMGPIFPRANLFTAYSGGTSVDLLSQDFQVARDSDEVESIILNIDSPGGVITGISEFADQIFQARGDKPIIAFVFGYAASAAYWIASAADEIVTTDTGVIGSIGVVAGWTDTRKRDEKLGIENIEIVSSQSPKKRVDIQSAEGRREVQQRVDELADVFVGAVARNRDIDTEAVLADFGEGGVFVAQRAIEAGMADRIGSLEGLIEDENTSAASTNSNRRFLMAEKQGAPITVDAVRTTHPEVFKAIFAEGIEAGTKTGIETGIEKGRTEGAEAERDRIKGIMAIDAPGFEKIVTEAAFDPEMNRDKVSTRILEAQKEGRTKKEQAETDDATKVGDKASKVQDGKEGPGEDDSAEMKAIVDAGAAGGSAGRQ